MAQWARPAQDISRGSWTRSDGATADLWAAIDEPDPPDDSDLIQSPNNANTTGVFRLSPVTVPLIRRLHVLSVRVRKSAVGGNTRGLTVELMQGPTVIAAQIHADLTALWPTVPLVLTPERAQTITDYTALDVRLTTLGTVSGGGAQRRAVQVSQVALRVPEAGDLIDDLITRWGVVVDETVPGTVTATLDGVTGTGPRRADALVDLWAKLREAEPTDPVRDRRWHLAYYTRKDLDYRILRQRIVTNPTPEDTGHYTQAEALARIDGKLGNFRNIVQAADAAEAV